MSTIDSKSLQISGVKPDPEIQKEKKLAEASKKMEAVFLSHMIKAMERTIPRDKDSGSNNLARMMFSSVMGDAIAGQGGIGLAEFIQRSLAEHGENPLEKLKNDVNLDALYHIKPLRLDDE
jgi:Rod binding domain-containing protein